MTEKQWLTYAIGALVAHVRSLGNDRKLRLFNCACSRMLLPWIPNPQVADALDRAEQFADGEIAVSTMRKWHRVVRKALDSSPVHAQPAAERKACWVCVFACWPGPEIPSDGWRYFVYHGGAYGGDFEQTIRPRLVPTLHDIYGNPFRKVKFDTKWRTDTAVSLARGMYESRDFGAMPILADALQDAGCDNEDVLNHCRDTNQPHVRGCWVVDLVLGKS
jgi:hypothetical protein